MRETTEYAGRLLVSSTVTRAIRPRKILGLSRSDLDGACPSLAFTHSIQYRLRLPAFGSVLLPRLSQHLTTPIFTPAAERRVQISKHVCLLYAGSKYTFTPV